MVLSWGVAILEHMFAWTTTPSTGLQRALESVRDEAASCGPFAVAACLRAADALIAAALALLGQGGFASASGMPAASLLQFEGGRSLTPAC